LARDRALDVTDRFDELRVACPQCATLDEHALGIAAVEPGGCVELGGAAGLAGLPLGVAEGRRRDCAAEDERNQYEGEPPEQGELAVRGAPAAHARGEVARTVRGRVAGGSHGSSFRCFSRRPRGSAAGDVCAICSDRRPSVRAK
jgi:hypothetical protein